MDPLTLLGLVALAGVVVTGDTWFAGSQCRLEANVSAADFRTSCRRVGPSPQAIAQSLRNDFQAIQRENAARREELAELKAQYAHMMETIGVLQGETTSWKEIIEWPLLDQATRPDNKTVLVPTDQPTYKDCYDAYNQGHRKMGIYALEPEKAQFPFFAFCDDEGWTLIERRFDGSTEFYRNWDAYMAGFGEVTKEFWLGLENIHMLTSQGAYEFKMEGLGYNDRTYTASYPEFSVAGEVDEYQLFVANMSLGNLRDALGPLNGKKFSTYDNDNDDWYGNNCAEYYHGAWWLLDCGFDPHRYYCEGQGCMGWGDRSLKKLVLKIRPSGAPPSLRKKPKRPDVPRPVYPTRPPPTRPPPATRPPPQTRPPPPTTRAPRPTRPARTVPQPPEPTEPPPRVPPTRRPRPTRKPKKPKKPKSGRPKKPKKPKKPKTPRNLRPKKPKKPKNNPQQE